MMNTRLSKALIALVAVATVGACDGPVVDVHTNEAVRIDTNPSFVVIEAGETRTVNAHLEDALGGSVPGDVTYSACDGAISVAADTTQTDAEPGTNFTITGNTLGQSCVNVSAGGFEETINVRVVPADITLTASDTLLSGSTVAASVLFENAEGGAATGFDLDEVTFVSLDTTIAVVDAEGNITARAPGTAQIAVTLNSGLGAPRGDTISAVVVPGTFTGTATPPSGPGGTMTTFDWAASDPAFDETSGASVTFGFNTFPLFSLEGTNEGTFVTRMPYGVEAGSGTVVFSGLGDAEVALSENWNLTAMTANDPFEPNNLFDGTPATVLTGPLEDVLFVDGEDQDDIFTFTVTETTDVSMFMDWDDANGSHDLDVAIINSTFTAYVCAGGATGNKPEDTSCTLQPGTYFLWVNNYDAGHGGSQGPTNYYLRFTGL